MNAVVGLAYGWNGYDGLGNTLAQDGHVFVRLGNTDANGFAYLNTTITGLMPGSKYQVSWFYTARNCPYNPDGCRIDGNDLNVAVNNEVLFTAYPVLRAATTGWLQGTLEFTQTQGGGSTASLSFFATNPCTLSGYWNDVPSQSGNGHDNFVDNVQVSLL